MFLAWAYDDPNGRRGWATKPNRELTDEAKIRAGVMNADMPLLIEVARWRWYHEGKWR